VVHPDIQNRYWDGIVREMLQKSFRFAEGIYFITRGFKQAGQRLPDRWIVIHQTNNWSNIWHAPT